MAVYRFRITFEDFDDIHRDIEIRSTQSFEDLHLAIHGAIGFDPAKPSSFYMSDDYWKKGKEITTRDLKDGEKGVVLIMKKTRLCDCIADPHQKIYYIFDFSSMWTFHIELIKILVNEDPGAVYPRCIKVTGEAPKQYGVTNLGAVPDPEDFDDNQSLIDMEEELPEGTEGDEAIVAADETGIVAGDDLETADDELIDEEGATEGEEF
ncbi:MAG: hypothetical protein NT126_07045 [Bacteroidetes bacterium]|nr:hypothetical protein [Bacteroidota bacterium]